MSDLFTLSSSELSKLSSSMLSCISREVRFYMSVKCRLIGIQKFYTANVDRLDSVSRISFNIVCERLSAILLRLDNNSVITYRSDIEWFRSCPKTLKDHIIQLFPGSVYYVNGYPKDRFIEYYFERLKEASIAGRKRELCSRLELAGECFLQDRGWFAVFNTLTVDDANYSKVFSKGSKAWQSYIEKCDHLFGRASFGSVRSARLAKKRGEFYHEYFAVTERGSTSGRLHIHVLHFFRDMPDSFSDPNFGARVPSRREIVSMRNLWSYGFSSPICVRFSQNDAYGRKGWIWPVSVTALGLQPIKGTVPLALMKYVAKYVSKRYDGSVTDRGYLWRVKLSRNLGHQKVLQYLDQVPIQQKVRILRHQLKILVNRKPLPKLLTRRLLLRQLIKSSSDYESVKLSVAIRQWSPLKSLLEQLRDSMKILWTHNHLNFGHLNRNEYLFLDICKPEDLTKPIGGICERVY